MKLSITMIVQYKASFMYHHTYVHCIISKHMYGWIWQTK